MTDIYIIKQNTIRTVVVKNIIYAKYNEETNKTTLTTRNGSTYEHYGNLFEYSGVPFVQIG